MKINYILRAGFTFSKQALVKSPSNANELCLTSATTSCKPI